MRSRTSSERIESFEVLSDEYNRADHVVTIYSRMIIKNEPEKVQPEEHGMSESTNWHIDYHSHRFIFWKKNRIKKSLYGQQTFCILVLGVIRNFILFSYSLPLQSTDTILDR